MKTPKKNAELPKVIIDFGVKLSELVCEYKENIDNDSFVYNLLAMALLIEEEGEPDTIDPYRMLGKIISKFFLIIDAQANKMKDQS